MKKSLEGFIPALIALAVVVTLQASDTMKAIVDSYLEIQAQLAADKFDAIKAPARAIADRAAQMGTSGNAIAKAAAGVERAADLSAAREAFGALSDAVIAAARAEEWKDVKDVKIAFCPMVKRSWLQKDEKIQNPYFGTQMSTCGEFKKAR
jgi:predicted RNA methylase